MRNSHVHDFLHDPERLARIEAHRARVESDAQLRFKSKKRKSKPVRKPWWSKWVRKIDRVNAMARNRGYSQ